MGARPVFLAAATWEGALDTTSVNPGLGSNVHADVGFLEQGPAANALRSWLQHVRTERPGTSPLTGRVVNSSGEGIDGVTIHSGIHRMKTTPDGYFNLPGLTGSSRVVTFSGAAATPPGGFTVPLSDDGYPAGDLAASFVLDELLADQTIPENNEALFSVSVSSASSVTYQWFHDGVLLQGKTEQSLVLSAVNPDHSGLYTVIVTAPDGAQAESVARLTVIESLLPYIRQHPVSYVTSQSGPTQFSVEAGGAPPLNYQWYFNSKVLTGATASNLTVLAGTATAGSYTVVVSNANGTVESMPATLNYVGPDPFTAIAVADSMVHDRFPSTNHNSSPLQVSARGSIWNRKTYLSFSLAGALPPDSEFSQSELRLNFPPSGHVLIGAATGMVTLRLYAITDGNDSWSETGITWANAPKNTDTPPNGFEPSGTVLLATVLIDSTTVANGAEFSFSSAALTHFMNWASGLRGDAYGTGLATAPDGRITLMISTSGATTDPGFYFINREAATPATAPRINGYLRNTAGAHLESWRDEWFGTTESAGNAADDADPNGNGIPNLLEYTFGSNPLIPERVVFFATSGLWFPRPIVGTDTVLSIQVSDDLEIWQAAAQSVAGQPFEMLLPGYSLTQAEELADYLIFAPNQGSNPLQTFFRLHAKQR